MDDRPTGIKKSYLIVPCLAISIASRPDPESAVNGDSTVTCKQTKKAKDKDYLGASPGLVVMGGDSCSKGREFESRQRTLDGHFFTYLFIEDFVFCV